MKIKSIILPLFAIFALTVSPSASAKGYVYKFIQHAQEDIAAVWLAKPGKHGGYAFGWARRENINEANAAARGFCEQNRAKQNRGLKPCRRLSAGGAKCFALYIHNEEKKFRYSLARGGTKEKAELVARKKCGKYCLLKASDCAKDK